jgi:hypothetical protein
LAQTPASVVVTHDAASTGASLPPPSSPDPELLLPPLLLLPDVLPLLELPELLPLLDPELLPLPLLDPDELPPLEPPLLLELELDPLDPLSLQPVPATAAASATDATTPPTKTKRSFMPATVVRGPRHGSRSCSYLVATAAKFRSRARPWRTARNRRRAVFFVGAMSNPGLVVRPGSKKEKPPCNSSTSM